MLGSRILMCDKRRLHVLFVAFLLALSNVLKEALILGAVWLGGCIG